MRHPAVALAGVILSCAATVSIEAQRPISLDTLHVSAGSRLTAGAAAITRSVDVLDRAAIEAFPARSIADVVRRGLGVDLLARSPAQADLSIRGSSFFEQVLVLVDGVPINDRATSISMSPCRPTRWNASRSCAAPPRPFTGRPPWAVS